MRCTDWIHLARGREQWRVLVSVSLQPETTVGLPRSVSPCNSVGEV
jgi:hypothetical protein